jgi:hypothetical protein
MFYYNCRDCGEKQHVSVGGVDDVFSEEVKWKEFSIDVGVKNQSGEVVGAVEVFKTHACTQKKLDEFFNGNIGWVEVQAKNVLKAYQDGIYEVKVICQHCFCENCRSKIKKRKLETEEENFDKKFAKRFIDLSDKQKQKIEKEAVAEFIQGKANVMSGIENELKESYTEELTEVGCSFAMQAFKLCYEIKPQRTAPDEMQKMSALTHNMMKNLLEMCSEMGVTKELFVDHSNSLLDPDATILNFGQFSGHTLEQIEDNGHWHYIVFCAGFNGTKVGKRPELADPQKWKYVPKNIVKIAREIIRCRCYKCGEETDEDWKIWCSQCFRCRY